jgi:hypothetical protein
VKGGTNKVVGLIRFMWQKAAMDLCWGVTPGKKHDLFAKETAPAYSIHFHEQKEGLWGKHE